MKYKLCNLLMLSTLLFFIPIYIFIKKITYHKKSANLFEYFLATLLFLNIIISMHFWYEGERHSTPHYIDGIFAKLSMLLVMLYVIFFKKLHLFYILSFLFILSCVYLMSYYSNEFSSTNWGCEDHIFYHSMFHICGSIGASFAFF